MTNTSGSAAGAQASPKSARRQQLERELLTARLALRTAIGRELIVAASGELAAMAIASDNVETAAGRVSGLARLLLREQQ